MVRRRPPPGTNDRTFQMNLKLLVNTSYLMLDPNIRQKLFYEISEFFSLFSNEALTLGELQQARRQNSQSQDFKSLSAEATITGDWSEFSLYMPERKIDLAEFLGGCCQVTQMSVTCGTGYEGIGYGTPSATVNETLNNETLNGDCSPCPLGQFKEALDNSLCIECPRHMTTLSRGAAKQTACECKSGYSLFNASTDETKFAQNLDPRHGTCVAPGTLTVEDASQAAEVISLAVGTVIGTVVASAVGPVCPLITALRPVAAVAHCLIASCVFACQVASSVAGAVAGAGAGAGGACVGSCFPELSTVLL